MCILCGEFMGSFHWSDLNLKEKTTSIIGENSKEYKRQRLKRVDLLNKILSFYALSVEDWQGARFILRDKKGQSELVNDLGDLWIKANKLSTKPIDILDESLLSFLQLRGEENSK